MRGRRTFIDFGRVLYLWHDGVPIRKPIRFRLFLVVFTGAFIFLLCAISIINISRYESNREMHYFIAQRYNIKVITLSCNVYSDKNNNNNNKRRGFVLLTCSGVQSYGIIIIIF